MRDYWEFVIDLLPITFRSVSAVGLERPRGSRPKPTRPRPEPTRPRPRPRPQPTRPRPRPRPRFFGLEAEARPRGLTSLPKGKRNTLHHSVAQNQSTARYLISQTTVAESRTKSHLMLIINQLWFYYRWTVQENWHECSDPGILIQNEVLAYCNVDIKNIHGRYNNYYIVLLKIAVLTYRAWYTMQPVYYVLEAVVDLW